MINIALYISAGFLSAGLISVLLFPTLINRAARRSVMKVKKSLPYSIEEMIAQKDQLRAEFALSIRNLEIKLEKTSKRLVEKTIELENMREKIADTQKTSGSSLSLFEQTKMLNSLDDTLQHTVKAADDENQKIQEQSKQLPKATLPQWFDNSPGPLARTDRYAPMSASGSGSGKAPQNTPDLSAVQDHVLSLAAQLTHITAKLGDSSSTIPSILAEANANATGSLAERIKALLEADSNRENKPVKLPNASIPDNLLVKMPKSDKMEDKETTNPLKGQIGDGEQKGVSVKC